MKCGGILWNAQEVNEKEIDQILILTGDITEVFIEGFLWINLHKLKDGFQEKYTALVEKQFFFLYYTESSWFSLECLY